MNGLVRTSYALGAGLAAATAAFEFWLNAHEPSLESQYRAIGNCATAVHLGNMTVDIYSPPDQCDQFAEDYKRTVTPLDALGRPEHVPATTFYSFPPEQAFTADQDRAARKRHAADEIAHGFGAGVVGALVTVVAAVGPTYIQTRLHGQRNKVAETH